MRRHVFTDGRTVDRLDGAEDGVALDDMLCGLYEHHRAELGHKGHRDFARRKGIPS